VAADAEETTETNFNGYTVVNMSSLGQNDGLKRSNVCSTAASIECMTNAGGSLHHHA
jgi:hypothetical protein